MLQASVRRTAGRAWARANAEGRGRQVLLGLALIGLFGIGGLGEWVGCSAQTGMFCQQQSDCRPGLVCNKPPGTSRPDSYGVCEPARRGTGEACLRSSDCGPGLFCSIEIGSESPDERHGICLPSSGPDAGPSDLGAGELSDGQAGG